MLESASGGGSPCRGGSPCQGGEVLPVKGGFSLPDGGGVLPTRWGGGFSLPGGGGSPENPPPVNRMNDRHL